MYIKQCWLTIGLCFLGMVLIGQPTLHHVKTGLKLPASAHRAFETIELDLFATEEPLYLKLISDFNAFRNNRYTEEPQEAVLIIRVRDSLELRTTTRIKAGGNSRKRLCDMPPIRLNLKKTELINIRLDLLEKVKLVSVCQPGKLYQNCILKEYLVYQLYRELTEKSFRVRLVQLHLGNPARPGKEAESIGFIVEEGEALAGRLDLEYAGTTSLLPEQINPRCHARLALFQYMIGNTDWSLKGGQNLKTLQQPEGAPESTFSVPFDFDNSGLVDAPYAVPSAVGLRSVKERLFMGECLEQDALEQAMGLFVEKRPQLNAIIQDFALLPEREKKRMIKYLDGFYKDLEKVRAGKRQWPNPCEEH